MRSLTESMLRNEQKDRHKPLGFSREALSFSIDFFRFYIRSLYSLLVSMLQPLKQ